ncbi:MAG: bis(5'-nucleosyl)-tetraphosphatase (symmetrical), partial [Legionellales bacterium RIFCSPHIGHO2_12_FULL_42_9]
RDDRLWFVGDLVNRGPQSLDVLRFIKNLPVKPRITLGNHDLHLLNKLFVRDVAGRFPESREDTLQAVLQADDAEELGHWLRQQDILYHDAALNVVMCHAGIAPAWDLPKAKHCAHELEQVLRSPDFLQYLATMYGNKPDSWSDELTGSARLRVMTNYLTRMRFCDEHGRLFLHYKGTIAKAPPNLVPWFLVKNRQLITADIVFGHWAALEGQCLVPGLYAVDTGCVWGGRLTALRLQDRRYFSVK